MNDPGTNLRASIQQANLELRELWKEQLKVEWPWPKLAQLWPMQYVDMQPQKVLFVGLNPSHDDESTNLLTIRNPCEQDLSSAERMRAVIEREGQILGSGGNAVHRYFRQFSEFAPDQAWNHIDLLAVRCTSQAQLCSALGLDGSGERNSFVVRQIGIALNLARALNPPVVVVANARAATLVLERLADLKFDEEAGYHWATLGRRRIPFFFSGMLTGQRALDRESRNRLIWHVQRALAAVGYQAARP